MSALWNELRKVAAMYCLNLMLWFWPDKHANSEATNKIRLAVIDILKEMAFDALDSRLKNDLKIFLGSEES